MEDIVKHKIRKTTTLVAKVFGKSQSIDHVPAIKYGRLLLCPRVHCSITIDWSLVRSNYQ
jgi:hypothetical protein